MSEQYNTEIEHLKRKISWLEQQLTTDELTGILNRRGLMQALDALHREVSYQLAHPDKRKNITIRQLSVLFFDIDHFKQVNTDFGHNGGDVALRAVAQAITGRLRGIDVIGRYGGEEIVVGLAGADTTAAQRVADDIRKIIEILPIAYDDKSITVTLSCGVASLKPNEDLETIIKRADSAAYSAKNNGRNQVVVS